MKLVVASALSMALIACGGSHKAPADRVEADAWDDDDDEALDDDSYTADGSATMTMTEPSPVIARPAVYDRGADSGSVTRTPGYTGATIDLDLKDADLHNVFRLLADVGGVNIVVSDQVRGTITLRLRRVPWDQALHTIVRSKQLSLKHDQGLYLVMPKVGGQ